MGSAFFRAVVSLANAARQHTTTRNIHVSLLTTVGCSTGRNLIQCCYIPASKHVARPLAKASSIPPYTPHPVSRIPYPAIRIPQSVSRNMRTIRCRKSSPSSQSRPAWLGCPVYVRRRTVPRATGLSFADRTVPMSLRNRDCSMLAR